VRRSPRRSFLVGAAAALGAVAIGDWICVQSAVHEAFTLG
jgi:hypothetical protein